MRKRLFSLFLALCFLMGLMPTALAALPASYEYARHTGEMTDGVYALYTHEDDGGDKNRILYHTGSGKTDKVTGTVSGDTLTLNSGFAPSRQLWTIAAVEDGNRYTVQNLDSGRYLDLSQTSGSNLATSDQAVALTITVEDDLYTFSNGETYLSFNPSGNGAFLTGSTGYGMRLYQRVEVEPGMAPGADAGTSAGQPFVKGDTGSQYFRIPALLTLDNGWIVAASDIRWRTSGDSPQNLDTIVSVSKDGGATWNWEVVNYYADMADTATGQASASFIDPSILQAEDGTVHMVVDACPSYVGLMSGNRMGWNSSGFDAAGRMLVSKGTAGGDASKVLADYAYYVDINNAAAGQRKTVGEETVTLYPICQAADGSPTGVWVDAWLNLYEEEDGAIVPDLCLQLSSSDAVQSNLFYRNSPWKAYPVFYIMHRSATVTTDGLEWGDPTFLDIKLTENEAFTGVCPGRGLSFRYNGRERLVFPLYDNATGTELASIIYSDDGGRTWTRGEHNGALNGVGKTSESQVVLLPDGTLRMYSRNTIGAISYADSTDGGVTWGACQRDNALAYTSNCMVSFLNLDGALVGPDDTVYEHLILASYPKSYNRQNGVVRIGFVDDRNTVTWLNDDTTRFSGGFSYSCLTQLDQAGTFGLLYEYAPDTNTIGYTTLTITDLLGEGWRILNHIPSISLDRGMVDLWVGEQTTLTATCDPADARVTWTSSDPDVAAVNDGTITAVAPGTAVIRAAISADGFTRSATAEVTVQGGSGTVVPDRYRDSLTEIDLGGNSAYLLDLDGVNSGAVYAVYHGASNRILYHASGANATDQVDGGVNGARLTLNGKFAVDNQTWTIAQAEGGYTLQSKSDGGYLNLNGVTQPAQRVPVGQEAQVLTITPVEGGYTISRTVGEQTFYLAHEDATTQYYVDTQPHTFRLYFQGTGQIYNTSDTGLKDLLDDLAGLREEDYTAASWAAYRQALEGARGLGAGPYADRETAQRAQDRIGAAAGSLYGAYLRLVEKVDVVRVTLNKTAVKLAVGEREVLQAVISPAEATVQKVTWTSSNPKIATVDQNGVVTAQAPGVTVITAEADGVAAACTVTVDSAPPFAGHAITAVTGGNGTVTVSPSQAKAGELVTILAVPDRGYAVGGVTVTSALGQNIPVTGNRFTMPAASVIVRVTFVKSGQTSPFADVPVGSWYYDAVMYAAQNGLMNGTGNGRFSPEMNLSRAMLMTMLARLDGENTAGGDTWYAKGLAWAVRNGISDGTNPNGDISREQMVTMLYRYAGSPAVFGSLAGYPDGAQVSEWARNAMIWAVQNGLIYGVDGGRLNPAGAATRMEVAAVLMRFCENVRK